MTFCLGIRVKDGLVALADTRITSGNEVIVARKVATRRGDPAIQLFKYYFNNRVYLCEAARSDHSAGKIANARRHDLHVAVCEDAGWQDVHGELQTFDDPADRLAAIDALEGFHPGAPSLYLRVLLPVRRNAEYVAAWTYVGPS